MSASDEGGLPHLITLDITVSSAGVRSCMLRCGCGESWGPVVLGGAPDIRLDDWAASITDHIAREVRAALVAEDARS